MIERNSTDPWPRLPPNFFQIVNMTKEEVRLVIDNEGDFAVVDEDDQLLITLDQLQGDLPPNTLGYLLIRVQA